MIFKKKNITKRVDFIGIGAQKAGTTALDYYLRQHPGINLPKKKELHYFDIDENFKENRVNYNTYHELFNFEKGKLVGEITPIYCYWRNSLLRIKEYNKSVKLIFILRNPINRAYSHWQMEKNRLNESLSFFEAIKIDVQKQEFGTDRIASYLRRGLYSKQIIKLQELFSENQILYVKYEDFLSNQEKVLDRIFLFLGLEKLDTFEFKTVHKTSYVEKKINPLEYKLMKEYFKSDITEVEKLLNWNCNDWKV